MVAARVIAGFFATIVGVIGGPPMVWDSLDVSTGGSLRAALPASSISNLHSELVAQLLRNLAIGELLSPRAQRGRGVVATDAFASHCCLGFWEQRVDGFPEVVDIAIGVATLSNSNLATFPEILVFSLTSEEYDRRAVVPADSSL
jgi:hypothetical protein